MSVIMRAVVHPAPSGSAHGSRSSFLGSHFFLIVDWSFFFEEIFWGDWSCLSRVFLNIFLSPWFTFFFNGWLRSICASVRLLVPSLRYIRKLITGIGQFLSSDTKPRKALQLQAMMYWAANQSGEIFVCFDRQSVFSLSLDSFSFMWVLVFVSNILR